MHYQNFNLQFKNDRVSLQWRQFCEAVNWKILTGHFYNRYTLRPRQNDHQFGDISKCIFLNENVSISIKILLQFVPKCPITNIPALVRAGAKPLSEPLVAYDAYMRHSASMS